MNKTIRLAKNLDYHSHMFSIQYAMLLKVLISLREGGSGFENILFKNHHMINLRQQEIRMIKKMLRLR